ncbi:hypothetical protein [Nocardia sp. NPDC005978]|uniref:hypothetical protein n=1 Tax=unclassified Nocardia TaxID=2637762 RepID=UPI0033A1E6F7
MRVSNGSSRIGWGTAVFVMASVAVAVTSAPASAGLANLAVRSVTDPGQALYVGGKYSIGVSPTPGDSAGRHVSFYDNGRCVGSGLINSYGGQAPAGAGIFWVPSTAGTHTLLARRGSDSVSITVTVAPTPDGVTPVEQPKSDGCGIDTGSVNVGSFDSGSIGPAWESPGTGSVYN